MADKYFINSVESSVDDCYFGFSKLHPNLTYISCSKIMFDSNSCTKSKFAVVSGGGSGHEPFPAGYVGRGMLTASVSGSIFTSPPSIHVLHAIRLAAAESAGVLLIVPNYTGDVLNFGLATEIAKTEGISVESVIVGEDIAQEIQGIPNKAGKRGMCGLLLMFKIAGYLSETGGSAKSSKKLLEEASKSMASLGLCVEACTKPGTGLLFRLDPEEAEFGVGVHGEAGVARFRQVSARDSVARLLNSLIWYLKLEKGNEVVVLVNNLGSLSAMEQWLLAGEVEKQLNEKSINVVRLYAGRLFTSLNMKGFQICVLKIQKESRTIFLEALDYETESSAWPGRGVFKERKPVSFQNEISSKSPGIKFVEEFVLTAKNALLLKKCFMRAAEKLLAEENYLNKLDSVCGDGDCGTTISHIAQEIHSLEEKNFSKPTTLFFQLSLAMQERIGGTTGALYGLFFKGVSQQLEKHKALGDGYMVHECWRNGIDSIKKYSKARQGDRTMLDPLEAASEAFYKEYQRQEMKSFRGAFKIAVEASRTTTQNTTLMKALAGRASYSDRAQHAAPDAGAHAVTVWLLAISEILDNQSTLDHNEETQCG